MSTYNYAVGDKVRMRHTNFKWTEGAEYIISEISAEAIYVQLYSENRRSYMRAFQSDFEPAIGFMKLTKEEEQIQAILNIGLWEDDEWDAASKLHQIREILGVK